MAKNRDKGIIFYGTTEDREKLAALAQVTGKSGSEFLVTLLREKYSAVFGDEDPKRIISQQ